jgi:hypothetical protein
VEVSAVTTSTSGSADDRRTPGPRVVTVSELLAGAQDVRPLDDAPGKSGARLKKLRIDGVDLVAKYLDPAMDWTVRASGMLGGPVAKLWTSGILHRLPDCLNQPIVGVATDDAAGDMGTVAAGGPAADPADAASGVGAGRPGPNHRRTVLLMHDVGADLVPATDEPLPLATHLRLLEHMAAMHAAFWDGGQEIEVVPVMHRYLELSPWTAMAESAIGSTHLVPQLIGRGWPLLAQVAPAAAAVVTPLAWDPGPLVQALAATPQTFVHGNWKLDNLGTDPAGRTIVLDWEMPGRGAALSDLAWYLAINCRRLPQAKESAIEAYRAALENLGIDTSPWWDRQLALSLLGALVQFGWEKALGGYDDELAWWEDQAVSGARVLASSS